MPVNVFGNSNSNDNANKIDTSLFVQKSYLRIKYLESNLQEDIDLENQYRNQNLPCPQETSDPVCKSYADNLFNDSSIIRNNAHIDLNDR